MHPGFKPMLCAKDFDLSHLVYPLLVSDKYDGIRNCQIPGMGGVSRKIEPIPNKKLNAYMMRDELAGLDGEFIIGSPTRERVRQLTQGAWSRHDGPAPGDNPDEPVRFYVFDDFTYPELGKLARYQRAKKRVEDLNDPHIVMIEHKLVDSAGEAYLAFKDAEERGFEGIILSSPFAHYKFGRDTAPFDRDLKKQGIFEIPLLIQGKVKSFNDEEGVIVGFKEEMHNENEAEKDAFGRTKRGSSQENKTGKGTLGAFILENPKYPKHYRVGTGFTAAQRKDYWERREELMGKKVTYTYQPSGMDVVPQFTVFVDFRLDM